MLFKGDSCGTYVYTTSHLHDGKRWKGEELGHPQLKVEAEAVEERPDVNELARAQPQGGDGKSAGGCKELFKDLIVIPTNVVINIPAKVQHRLEITCNAVPP